MNEEMKNGMNTVDLAPGAEINMDAAAPSVSEQVQGLDGANGEYTHRFKKPFEWEGQHYEKIYFNFAKLTGKDMNAIEREMQAVGESAYTAETSKVYQCRIAARASKSCLMCWKLCRWVITTALRTQREIFYWQRVIKNLNP